MGNPKTRVCEAFFLFDEKKIFNFRPLKFKSFAGFFGKLFTFSFFFSVNRLVLQNRVDNQKS